MKNIKIAVFVILAHIFPIFSSLADQKGNDPFNGGALSLQMEGNEFPNDESPICCNISFKKGKTVTRWDDIIDLGIAYTGIDYGLGFEVICDKDGLPLKQKRDDIPREQIKRNSINSVIWNLRILYDLDVAGKYKVRAFYKIDEVLGTIDGPPSPGRTVKVLSHEENIYSIKSDWATFEIVDNSKERDAKIKEYRDAFQSGDKKKVLEYLERLEKDTTFEIVKIMSGDLFALTKNTDKAVSEKASRTLLENTEDSELLALLKKDDELLNRIMKIASSSESPDLRLLASKSIERTQIHGNFYIKDIPMWFAKEKDDTVRSALISNVYDKNVLLDAIKNSDNIQVKVTSFKNLVRIGDKDLAVKEVEQMQTDMTPVKYDGQDTTVGAVMNLQIKKLRDMEAEVIKEGSDLSDMYRSY